MKWFFYITNKMNKKIIIAKLLSTFFWISIPYAQIEFQVTWTPYVTYYLSMVDINTGESNMPIFMAELSREDSDATQPVEVDIEFELGKLSISIDEKNNIHMKGPVSDIKEIDIKL